MSKPKILTDIESKLNKDSIVNDLTTGGIDKVASAETVKTLNISKADKQDLIANDLIKLTSNLTLYVATTGSDTTGDGTSAKPFVSIQKAIDSVPKNLGGYNVEINVSAGTYVGNLNIIGFRNGKIEIKGASALANVSSYVISGEINIRYNDNSIILLGFKITGYVESLSSFAFIRYCDLSNTGNTIGVGVSATIGGELSVRGCNISNKTYGAISNNSSILSISDTTISNCGTGIDIGSSGGNGSICFKFNVTMTGNATNNRQSYGSVIIEDGVPINVSQQMEQKADIMKMSTRITFEDITANKGFLIKTDILFLDGHSFFIELKGNTYVGGDYPINTLLQGYIYNNGTIYTSKALNLGNNIPAINVFNLNNKLCLWIDYDVYFTGLQVNAIYDVKEHGGNFTNLVTEITIETKPAGITQEVVCIPEQVATTDKVDILWSGSVSGNNASITIPNTINKYKKLLFTVKKTGDWECVCAVYPKNADKFDWGEYGYISNPFGLSQFAGGATSLSFQLISTGCEIIKVVGVYN